MRAQDEYGDDTFTAMIGAEAIRELLHDLSEARELLAGQEGSARALELINKSYNNLLRRNAEP